MKVIRLFSLLFALCSGIFLQAQETTAIAEESSKSLLANIKDKKTGTNSIFPTISFGYYYLKQSFGEVGGQLVFPLKDDADRFLFRAGASAIMGATHGKFALMPKVKADLLFNPRKEVYVSHAYYYILGAETTTKSLAPYIGISILGLMDFTGGYSFPFSGQNLHGKEMKGFRLGISIHIPSAVFQ